MKNTRNFILHLVLVNLLLCGTFQYTYAQNVSATQNPPAYNNGQVQYNASSSSGSYNIYTDNKTAGQTLLNSNYNGGQITYSTNDPGIYFAKSFGDFGAAAYEPFEIKTTSTEPSNFDAYWSNVINNQLPSNPNAQLSNVQTQGNGVTTADLRLDNINGKKVYCKIAYPTNGSNMGAVLHIQSFSSTNTSGTLVISAFAAAYNVIAISISGITDVPYGQAPADTPPSTNPDDFYYKTSIAASYQALRYMASRPDYSVSKGIGLFGASQGAGLSLMVGGIDAKNDNLVKCLVITQPILCDNSAILFNKAAGFPNYVLSSGALDDNAVAAAAAYYDATHAAKRISDPVYFGIGYRDFVTHPAGNFAAFNELRGPVHLTHAINEGHNHAFNGFGVWTNPIAEMFFEKYINGNNASPSGSTVYFVDAGPDKTVSQGGTVSLSGTIDAKNAPTPSSVQWSCIDCPATPNFSNANSSTTNASFPANGTYTLRFGPVNSTGNAANKLYIPSGDPNLYHTAADYVVVTVGGVGCTDNDGDGFCQADDCNDFDANFPKPQGTPCNDGNSNTNNDVIQPDGCTCAGTPGGGGGTTITCGEITITYGNGQIEMQGQSGSSYFFKVHDLNNGWAEVYSCSNTCGSSRTATDIDEGLYKVKIYDSGWNVVCDTDITMSDDGGCTDNDGDGVCQADDCNDFDPNFPKQVGTSCNDNNSNTENDVIQSDGCTCAGTPIGGGNPCENIQVSTSGSSVIITNTTSSLTLKIIGLGTDWSDYTICEGNCGGTQTVPNLVVGNYTVKAINSNPGCYDQQTVTLTSVPCIDNDNDGICQADDCNDFDANFPKPVGTSCNDNDPNTDNDTIQSDGCTCEGTPDNGGGTTVSCGSEITITYGNGQIAMQGQSDNNYYYQIHDTNQGWIVVDDCLDSSCGSSHTATLPPSNYLVRVLNSNWQGVCETNITLSSNKLIVDESDIAVYPNPADNEVNLALEALVGQQATITISNTMGQTVEVLSLDEIPDTPVHIHTDTYASGLYFIYIQTNDNQRISKKFVIM